MSVMLFQNYNCTTHKPAICKNSQLLMFGRLATTTIGRLAIIAIAALCAFWFANNAAAQQQNSVSYSASPSELVSVNADGQLIVLPQANAGLMTATIEATGYTLNAQNQYVLSGFDGERYITLNIVATCNVSDGCDIFGIPTSGNLQGRADAFRDMSLQTLSMFIAAGIDVNEQVGSQAEGFLLYRMAVADNIEAFSVLIRAGASVNAQNASGTHSLLHYAVFSGRLKIITLLLAQTGISVNPTLRSSTPLDIAAKTYDQDPTFQVFEAIGATLRNAGGICSENAASTDPEIVEICGTTAPEPPDIDISGNARTFIARSNSQTTSVFIGALSPVQGITYSALPANVVSVNGQTLQFIGRTAGNAILATVFGVAGTPPQAVTGTLALTINALASCSVRTGCAAFGFESAADTNARVAIFTAMSEATMSMFVASGANLNESTRQNDITDGRLALLLANAGQTALLSVFAHGGANLNYLSPSLNQESMLHLAGVNYTNNLGLRTLLSVGISQSLPESRRLNLSILRGADNFTVLRVMAAPILGGNAGATSNAQLIIDAGAPCSDFGSGGIGNAARRLVSC